MGLAEMEIWPPGQGGGGRDFQDAAKKRPLMSFFIEQSVQESLSARNLRVCAIESYALSCRELGDIPSM